MPKRTAIHLTDRFVESAKKTSDRQEIADANCAGLYFIIQPSGTKSWALRYRIADKPKKMTLGSYPAKSLKDARLEGFKLLTLVRDGVDPATGTKHGINGNDRFETVFLEYYRLHVEPNCRASTAYKIKRNFECDVLPVFRDWIMTSVKKADIRVLLENMVARGIPAKAVQTYTHMNTFFNWCEERDIFGIGAVSPMHRLSRPAKLTPRKRVLSANELRWLWRACGELIGSPLPLIVKGLLLTGQRRKEVGEIVASELHSDEDGRHWIIPEERAKNGCANLVPLTPTLCELFDDQMSNEDDGDYLLFRNELGKHVSNKGYGDGLDLIREIMQRFANEEAAARGSKADVTIPRWTLHDLRRTVSTYMAPKAMGIDREVVEALLNHQSGAVSGVAAVYNVYKYRDEKLDALLKWEAKLMQIVDPKGNVIPLRAA